MSVSTTPYWTQHLRCPYDNSLMKVVTEDNVTYCTCPACDFWINATDNERNRLMSTNISLTELQVLLSASEPILKSVHPVLSERCHKLITELCVKDSLFFGAFAGIRSWRQQDILYAQGRTTPGKVVTNARGGQSFHCYGLAVDFVEDGNPNNAGIQWSWKRNIDYLKIGKVAKQFGLEWGGYFKAFSDVPHVQLTAGYKVNELEYLYKVGGLENVWTAVSRRLAL